MSTTEQQQLLTDEQQSKIETFVDEMRDIASRLPTNDEGLPIDRRGLGEQREWELTDEITLGLDWYYLDAPSSVLVSQRDASGYERFSKNLLRDVSRQYEDLEEQINEIANRSVLIEYDEQYSDENIDVWQINGLMPL